MDSDSACSWEQVEVEEEHRSSSDGSNLDSSDGNSQNGELARSGVLERDVLEQDDEEEHDSEEEGLNQVVHNVLCEDQAVTGTENVHGEGVGEGQVPKHHEDIQDQGAELDGPTEHGFGVDEQTENAVESQVLSNIPIAEVVENSQEDAISQGSESGEDEAVQDESTHVACLGNDEQHANVDVAPAGEAAQSGANIYPGADGEVAAAVAAAVAAVEKAANDNNHGSASEDEDVPGANCKNDPSETVPGCGHEFFKDRWISFSKEDCNQVIWVTSRAQVQFSERNHHHIVPNHCFKVVRVCESSDLAPMYALYSAHLDLYVMARAKRGDHGGEMALGWTRCEVRATRFRFIKVDEQTFKVEPSVDGVLPPFSKFRFRLIPEEIEYPGYNNLKARIRASERRRERQSERSKCVVRFYKWFCAVMVAAVAVMVVNLNCCEDNVHFDNWESSVAIEEERSVFHDRCGVGRMSTHNRKARGPGHSFAPRTDSGHEEPAFRYICKQGKRCQVGRTGVLRYGVGNNWLYRQVMRSEISKDSGKVSFECSESFFGREPYPLVYNHNHKAPKKKKCKHGKKCNQKKKKFQKKSFKCYFRPDREPASRHICDENSQCKVFRAGRLEFGTHERWISKDIHKVPTEFTCNNKFFDAQHADQIPKNAARHCRFRPFPVQQKRFETICTEYTNCQVEQTGTIRYGKQFNWVYKEVDYAPFSFRCSNEFFGKDPNVGYIKECAFFPHKVNSSQPLEEPLNHRHVVNLIDKKFKTLVGTLERLEQKVAKNDEVYDQLKGMLDKLDSRIKDIESKPKDETEPKRASKPEEDAPKQEGFTHEDTVRDYLTFAKKMLENVRAEDILNVDVETISETIHSQVNSVMNYIVNKEEDVEEKVNKEQNTKHVRDKFYELLKLSKGPQSTRAEIRDAFHRERKATLLKTVDDYLPPEVKDHLRNLREAFATLSNPRLKREYDNKLLREAASKLKEEEDEDMWY